MSTKRNPGQFDCYANALPDEPMFVLLARDPTFSYLVDLWAALRLDAIKRGNRPESDKQMVAEAEECACAGSKWRRDNDGKWREPQT